MGINHSNMHGVNNRQLRVLEFLKKTKFTTVDDICDKIGVSKRTIQYDLAYLKKVYPNIKTYAGRYGGGIEWKD